MKPKEVLDDWVSITTDFSVLLRELCVVALFSLLFFWPDTFKTLLTRIGISKVSTVFGDIDVSSTGGTVATINRGLSDSIDRLQQIQSSSTDPQAKTDLATVATYLQGLQQQAQSADDVMKATLVNQQAAAEQASPHAVKPPGWIHMGRVSKDHEHWEGKTTRDIVPSNLSPNLTVGQKFNVATTTYLRDAASGGKVIGVLRANDPVQVTTAPTCSASIAGGDVCWVKVQPL